MYDKSTNNKDITTQHDWDVDDNLSTVEKQVYNYVPIFIRLVVIRRIILQYISNNNDVTGSIKKLVNETSFDNKKYHITHEPVLAQILAIISVKRNVWIMLFKHQLSVETLVSSFIAVNVNQMIK